MGGVMQVEGYKWVKEKVEIGILKNEDGKNLESMLDMSYIIYTSNAHPTRQKFSRVSQHAIVCLGG